jgi:hypothetical protein
MPAMRTGHIFKYDVQKYSSDDEDAEDLLLHRHALKHTTSGLLPSSVAQQIQKGAL